MPMLRIGMRTYADLSRLTRKFSALVRISPHSPRAAAKQWHGKRVRNTLVTYLEVMNKPAKAGLIHDGSGGTKVIPT